MTRDHLLENQGRQGTQRKSGQRDHRQTETFSGYTAETDFGHLGSMKLGVRVAKSGLARLRQVRLPEIRPGGSSQRGPGTELWDATGIAEQIDALHVLLSKGDREISRATDCVYLSRA